MKTNQQHADQRIATRDGTALVAGRYGSTAADAPRLVLIHSLAMDRFFWTPVIDAIGNDAAILAYDCRGHGQSDKPTGPYSTAQFADDLADVLTQIGWNSAVVAGASMGGCVALAFAGKYPQRTTGLGLIDTTAWYGIDAPMQWAERAERALQGGMQALVEFQTKRWFGDAFRAKNPAVVARTVDTLLKNDLTAYAATCEMLGAADLRKDLLAMKMPAAVIVGEEDYATPIVMAEAMHSQLKNSHIVVLPGARHFTPLERPKDIARELQTLLQHVQS